MEIKIWESITYLLKLYLLNKNFWPNIDIQWNFDLIPMHIYTYLPITLDPRTGSRGVSDIPPNWLSYEEYCRCGKLIAVWLRSISRGDAVNSLIALYDIQGRKKEELFFYSFLDITRHSMRMRYIYCNLAFAVFYHLNIWAR
jgi:hypothetical protein